MNHPPDWLNSIMFLLIGIWIGVRRMPVRRESVAPGLEIHVQDPGPIDKVLGGFYKFQMWALSAILGFAFLRYAYEAISGTNLDLRAVGL